MHYMTLYNITMHDITLHYTTLYHSIVYYLPAVVVPERPEDRDVAADVLSHPVPIAIFCLTRSFPRVGLPRSLCFIGGLTAALRFSKGWVRKYHNLLMGIGCRDNILHTRKRHLRNRRGFPAACSVAFSNTASLFSSISEGLSLVQWFFTGIVQWTFNGIFQMEFHFCDVWCVQ